MKLFTNWLETGINTKGKTTGNIKVKCPQCPPDRGHPNDTSLSVNNDKKLWNCHYCGWKGSLTERTNAKERTYQKPSFQPASPTPEMAKWFQEKRGIMKTTLDSFLISPVVKDNSKSGKKEIHLAFPYFKDRSLVNVKHRYDQQLESGKIQKGYSLEKGCELPFYNIDTLLGGSMCVITEGEIDTLTVFQVTGYPSISIPTGASQEGQKQKLECLDIDFDKFSKINTIILATDNDAPGLALRQELARRLGKERCYYIDYPDDCKDINEVLVKHGEEAVKQAFANYQSFPIEGVITVADMDAEIDDLYQNGYPVGESIGFTKFDNLLTFRGGEVTTITGIPGHGKSEFLDEILIRLAQKGWRHGIYSAENQPVYLHFAKLADRYIGKRFYHQDTEQQMSPEEAGQAKQFVNNQFYFINELEVETTVDGLIAKAKELVQRKGIKSFVIDPYNCMDHQRPGNISETEYVSLVYSKLVKFALHYDVHVFLVAHPTKLSKDPKTEKYEIPTLYSIAGSANFFNKTFNGICVYRHSNPDRVAVYVQKVKFKFIGQTGFSTFTYNTVNGRYEEEADNIEL